MSNITREDLKDFIVWAKNKEGEYQYGHPRACPIAKYLQARGFRDVRIGSSEFHTSVSQGRLPTPLDTIVRVHPHSYEGLTKRARFILYAMDYNNSIADSAAAYAILSKM